MKNVWNIKCYLVRKIQQSSSTLSLTGSRAVRTTRWVLATTTTKVVGKEEEKNGMKIKLILFMNIFFSIGQSSYFSRRRLWLQNIITTNGRISFTHSVWCNATRRKIYLLKTFPILFSDISHKTKMKTFFTRFFVCAKLNIFATQTAHSIYKIWRNFQILWGGRIDSTHKKMLKIIWEKFS